MPRAAVLTALLATVCCVQASAQSEPTYDPVLQKRFRAPDVSLTGALPRRASTGGPFLLGVATAAHQVEGRNTNNDFFAYEVMCRDPKLRRRVGVHVALGPFVLPFKIQDMCANFDLAGEALRHRIPNALDADLDRARGLGLNAYRFSVEWSRIEPRPGEFRADVLRAYRRDIDAMLARGLQPMVGLHHFTLPLWLSDPIRGKAGEQGFMRPDIVQRFRAFVRVVVSALGDRVRYWTTMNEPVGAEFTVGYLTGIWPPGQVAPSRAPTALRNLALAHAAAYDEVHAVYRARRWPRPMVGFAHHMIHVKVAPPPFRIGPIAPSNVGAARRFQYYMNELFVDAVHKGCFRLRRSAPCDAALRPHLARRLDFLGVNYYRSGYAYFDLAVAAIYPFVGGRMDMDQSASPFVGNSRQPHALLNAMGWEISPEGFYRMLRHASDLTDGLPIVVTENGYPQLPSNTDPRTDLRAPYLLAHLQALIRAVREGVRVDGYIHWTLADNWEWQDAYSPKAAFGLFSVDRRDCRASLTPTGGMHIDGACTLPRRKTAGAFAYEEVARAGGVTPAMLRKYGTITPDGFKVVHP
jgi:beta-glucosidase